VLKSLTSKERNSNFTIMIVFANAKINLGLFILSKREDSYHNISSLKYPIPLFDVMEFLPSDSFQLKILGNEIDGKMEENLIFKAYSILKEKHGIGGVKIVIQKNIPLGAGLGGGSSNATFTMKALNDFFDLSLSEDEIREYVGRLGSDCPFFVANLPQLATQKGDVLQAFDLDLKGKYLYLIHPNIHVSTAEAYSRVVPKAVHFDWEKLKKWILIIGKQN
jgi:4-diphosphocytidyl-2-C-methyl-D-erythritol kinase